MDLFFMYNRYVEICTNISIKNKILLKLQLTKVLSEDCLIFKILSPKQ